MFLRRVLIEIIRINSQCVLKGYGFRATCPLLVSHGIICGESSLWLLVVKRSPVLILHLGNHVDHNIRPRAPCQSRDNGTQRSSLHHAGSGWLCAIDLRSHLDVPRRGSIYMEGKEIASRDYVPTGRIDISHQSCWLSTFMTRAGSPNTLRARCNCVTWYFMEAIWYIISFGIIHALVAMRVIAIWGRPRWIVVLLSSLWLTYFCTTLGILLASLFTKAHTVHFEPLIKVCYLTIAPFLWSCWIPPLLLEIVLFSLSCVQAFQAGKFTTRTPIIHVLFRDGALHFIVILACSVFNMVTWIVAPPTLAALAKYFGLPMVNVMISRMVLNLRSCQGQSRAHHFVATPGGGIQVHVSTDEVELSAATWNSKGQGQELEAQVGARAGLSPSRSTFKL
ncbi:hypothetical protein RSAG8_10304, partial [Rhizoctonia solani AG-8 WAC10335]